VKKHPTKLPILHLSQLIVEDFSMTPLTLHDSIGLFDVTDSLSK
jgi:hypothetical protein